MNRLIKLSASSIQAFKACPTRYRLKYTEGIRAERDTDSQRIGTNWHALHETYRNALAESDHDTAFAAAIEHLNDAYAAVPDWVEDVDWALERQVLATSFAAYLWYYGDDPIETLTAEQAFDLPVHNPKTGLPLPMSEVMRVGKIDGVIRWHGKVGTHEYKSTSKSIEDGSDYWEKLRLDDQVSMYALAFDDLPADTLAEWGVEEGDQVGVTLYDVWHKPSISRKDLTQKDTAAFIESKKYHGDEYTVEVETEDDPDYKYPKPTSVKIDGELAEFTLGKGGWALKETVVMFGSRLMADIAERPEFYFRRRPVPRTAEELATFRAELFNIYSAMRMFEKSGCWYKNGSQCRATFPCDMIPICHGPESVDAVCDSDRAPNGFKRRTPLTIGETE